MVPSTPQVDTWMGSGQSKRPEYGSPFTTSVGACMMMGGPLSLTATCCSSRWFAPPPHAVPPAFATHWPTSPTSTPTCIWIFSEHCSEKVCSQSALPAKAST
jgi:hypothetical protein